MARNTGIYYFFSDIFNDFVHENVVMRRLPPYSRSMCEHSSTPGPGRPSNMSGSWPPIRRVRRIVYRSLENTLLNRHNILFDASLRWFFNPFSRFFTASYVGDRRDWLWGEWWQGGDSPTTKCYELPTLFPRYPSEKKSRTLHHVLYYCLRIIDTVTYSQ